MDFISRFMEQHRLPDSFRIVARDYYLPFCAELCTAIQDRKQQQTRPFLLGINGAQGTGKSTLADFVAEYFVQDMDAMHKYKVAVLSIDDFYLTQSERVTLSEKVHPLLKVRGVPGTHDLSLAIDVVSRLLNKEKGIALPRFDKSVDDRAPNLVWPIISEPVDMIILEGWCVGSVPQEEDQLKSSINELEQKEDTDGLWREYVNNALLTEYPKLFNLIDYLVLLKAPDFESVYRWRSEQEEKLAEQTDSKASGIMSRDQIARFIQHYERLTRHNLKALPAKADKQFSLNRAHQIAQTDDMVIQ